MHSPSGTAQKARWSLLQVSGWRQTLEFCNKTAVIPVGLHVHTTLLDHLDDAFSVGEWRQELFWFHSYLVTICWAAHAF